MHNLRIYKTIPSKRYIRSMLAHRLRHWSNIESIKCKRLVFAGCGAYLCPARILSYY